MKVEDCIIVSFGGKDCYNINGEFKRRTKRVGTTN